MRWYHASYERDNAALSTLYSLHGLTGHYNDWARSGDFNDISNNHPEFAVVVLVEGENGWYVKCAA